MKGLLLGNGKKSYEHHFEFNNKNVYYRWVVNQLHKKIAQGRGNPCGLVPNGASRGGLPLLGFEGGSPQRGPGAEPQARDF